MPLFLHLPCCLNIKVTLREPRGRARLTLSEKAQPTCGGGTFNLLVPEGVGGGAPPGPDKVLVLDTILTWDLAHYYLSELVNDNSRKLHSDSFRDFISTSTCCSLLVASSLV